MCMNRLEKQMIAINKMADLVNKKWFEGKLPNIAITLQGDKGKKSTYGWFWAERWESKTEKVHELNITADNIDNVTQMFVTMHHELIHLHAKINDIQETSRQGRWHNKRFQNLCDEFGLYWVKDTSIGTRTPHTKEEGVKREYLDWVKECCKVEEIDKWLSSGDVFKRIKPIAPPKPKTIKSYTCGACGERVSLKIELIETLGEFYCPYCGDKNEVYEEE